MKKSAHYAADDLEAACEALWGSTSEEPDAVLKSIALFLIDENFQFPPGVRYSSKLATIGTFVKRHLEGLLQGRKVKPLLTAGRCASVFEFSMYETHEVVRLLPEKLLARASGEDTGSMSAQEDGDADGQLVADMRDILLCAKAYAKLDDRLLEAVAAAWPGQEPVAKFRRRAALVLLDSEESSEGHTCLSARMGDIMRRRYPEVVAAVLGAYGGRLNFQQLLLASPGEPGGVVHKYVSPTMEKESLMWVTQAKFDKIIHLDKQALLTWYDSTAEERGGTGTAAAAARAGASSRAPTPKFELVKVQHPKPAAKPTAAPLPANRFQRVTIDLGGLVSRYGNRQYDTEPPPPDDVPAAASSGFKLSPTSQAAGAGAGKSSQMLAALTLREMALWVFPGPTPGASLRRHLVSKLVASEGGGTRGLPPYAVPYNELAPEVADSFAAADDASLNTPAGLRSFLLHPASLGAFRTERFTTRPITSSSSNPATKHLDCVVLNPQALHANALTGLSTVIAAAWPGGTPLAQLKRAAAEHIALSAAGFRGPTGQLAHPRMPGAQLGIYLRQTRAAAYEAVSKECGRMMEWLDEEEARKKANAQRGGANVLEYSIGGGWLIAVRDETSDGVVKLRLGPLLLHWPRHPPRLPPGSGPSTNILELALQQRYPAPAAAADGSGGASTAEAAAEAEAKRAAVQVLAEKGPPHEELMARLGSRVPQMVAEALGPGAVLPRPLRTVCGEEPDVFDIFHKGHGIHVMRLVDPELIQLAAFEAQRARDQQQQQQAKPPPPQQPQPETQSRQQAQPAQAQQSAATGTGDMYDTNDIFAAAYTAGDGGANGGPGSPQRRARPHTPPGFSSPRSSHTGGASLPSPVPVPVPVPSPSDAVVSPAGFQPPGVVIPDGPVDPSAHSPYSQMQTPLHDPAAAQPLAAASIFWVAAADESGTPLTHGSPLVPTDNPPVAATAVTSMVQHVHSCQQVGLAVLTAAAQPSVLAVYAPYAVGVIDLGLGAAGGFGGDAARQVHVSFEPAVYLVDLAGAVTAAAGAAGAGHGGDPVAAATGEAAAALLGTLRRILGDPGICKVVHGVDQLVSLETACGGASATPVADIRLLLGMLCAQLPPLPPPPQPSPPSSMPSLSMGPLGFANEAASMAKVNAHVGALRGAIAATGLWADRQELVDCLVSRHFETMREGIGATVGRDRVWLSRPLPEAQLSLAAAAARHLPELWTALISEAVPWVALHAAANGLEAARAAKAAAAAAPKPPPPPALLPPYGIPLALQQQQQQQLMAGLNPASGSGPAPSLAGAGMLPGAMPRVMPGPGAPTQLRVVGQPAVNGVGGGGAAANGAGGVQLPPYLFGGAPAGPL